MIIDKKTVYENGRVAIVRISGYGHGCNMLSVSWDVLYDGKYYRHCLRLKDAKKITNELFINAA